MPRAADATEDDGWLIGLVVDAGLTTAALEIVHARAINAAPVAAIRLPRRLPRTFTGLGFPPDPWLSGPPGQDRAKTTNGYPTSRKRQRICLLGATGTIGRAVTAALVERGHDVVSFVRAGTAGDGTARAGATGRVVDVTDPLSLARDGFAGEPFDALVSCMASRTGVPADAWAIDYQAQLNALAAAQRVGVAHFVLLSAICVQKPLLAFQRAKLSFETALTASGMRYSIVRPTAFFKSLSGQIGRVRQGRPFLIFGDGCLTACKPISDGDLADYIVGCLGDESRWNRILPIGGPGEAITPRQQGEALFALLGHAPRFRSVPVALMSGIVGGLGALGRIAPWFAAKAELARIGRYYATESMLVLDTRSGRYDAAATPSTGTETLFDFYRAVLDGTAAPERGDHAVF